MNKIACNTFCNFSHRELCIKKSAKIQKCVFYLKSNPDFFQNFSMISLAQKNENCKIRHYSFKIADNDQKNCQSHLLLNPFHMVDAKFDLVLRPITHGNPAMPFSLNGYFIYIPFQIVDFLLKIHIPSDQI